MSKFCEIISSKSIMNKIRLLCLVMAICFTSGAKAQFYDRADEIYYYKLIRSYSEKFRQVVLPNGMPTLNYEKTGKIEVSDYVDDNSEVSIWNFDGRKAAQLDRQSLSVTKERMQKSPSYSEDLVETSDYNWKYISDSSYLREMKSKYSWLSSYLPRYGTMYERNGRPVIFSSDRYKMYEVTDLGFGHCYIYEYKRVDKSFFKVGRSRTPSGTLHE